MEMTTMDRGGAKPAAPHAAYCDPLDEDGDDDVVFGVTRRGLTRLALVATEVGARFQREQVGHDPMAWLLSPRALFRGAVALDACLDREECLRAVVLHGLSIGLDADPATIDVLLCDGFDGEAPTPWSGRDGRREDDGRASRRRLRLYSAVLVLARGGEILHLFHASVASSPAVVRERIRSRFGSAAAKQAEVRVGIDVECPLTMGMVPPALMATLVPRPRSVRWSTLAGLDVTVEQRIPS